MIDFYKTVMGHRFYEGTMPELVRQLTRLNTNIEKMLAAQERQQVALNDDETRKASGVPLTARGEQ